jgi:hypothetical protein
VTEVFHEVDAQMRAARFQTTVQRGWPYALGLAVVAGIVGLAAWGLNVHEHSVAAKASDGYAAAVQLLQSGDLKGADAKLAAVAKSDSKAYRALALMQQAGVAGSSNDQRAEISLLDQAAEAAPNQILGDAARLKAAYVVMDTSGYDAVHARLAPLGDVGRPYRLLAKEALAVSELAAGKLAQARERATAAIALIQSGSWASLTPIAKASAGLTPQAPTPQAGPGQMQPDQDQQPAPQAGAAQ